MPRPILSSDEVANRIRYDIDPYVDRTSREVHFGVMQIQGILPEIQEDVAQTRQELEEGVELVVPKESQDDENDVFLRVCP